MTKLEISMSKRQLTAERFDRLLQPTDRIQGAVAIAYELGVSTDTVQRWARDPMIPIYKPAGRYWASRAKLREWLVTKPVELTV